MNTLPVSLAAPRAVLRQAPFLGLALLLALAPLTLRAADLPAPATPAKLDPLYAARASAVTRQNAVAQGGGSKAGQEAVEKCLAWLASVQQDDGSWEHSPGHTGLATLVFLAHGETPTSDKYGATVQQACNWLATKVAAAPSPPNLGQNGYGEGIAIYALAEAYGMTHDAALRPAVEKGIAGLVKGQQPGGGYNYGYAQDQRWDLSLAGWQFQALKAAYVAGIATPGLEQAIDRACTFIKTTTYAKGKFGYASAGSGGNMTGVGTACLLELGEGEAAPVRGGCATISDERLDLYKELNTSKKTWAKDAGTSIYGWCYDTQALFLHEKGKGSKWNEWCKVYEPILIKNQRPDGAWGVDKGPGVDATVGGRILASSWCCLQLEVYYRYAAGIDLKKTLRPHAAPVEAAPAGEPPAAVPVPAANRPPIGGRPTPAP